MNAKEIAEVREELRQGWIIEGLDPAFLPRLLDEREALLEALRELSMRASDPDLLRGIFGARLMLECAVKEADAAIAKAEAE